MSDNRDPIEVDPVNNAFGIAVHNILNCKKDELRINPTLIYRMIIDYCGKYPEQGRIFETNILALNGDVEKAWDRYFVPLLMTDFFNVKVFHCVEEGK